VNILGGQMYIERFKAEQIDHQILKKLAEQQNYSRSDVLNNLRTYIFDVLKELLNTSGLSGRALSDQLGFSSGRLSEWVLS